MGHSSQTQLKQAQQLSQDPARQAVISAMMAIERRVQTLAPDPSNPSKRGFLFTQSDSRAALGGEHDGMLAMVAAQSFLSGVYGAGLDTVWDTAELASEAYTDRTNSRRTEAAGPADSTYSLGEKNAVRGTFNHYVRRSRDDLLEDHYKRDLPLRTWLERRYSALSRKLDDMEGRQTQEFGFKATSAYALMRRSYTPDPAGATGPGC